MSGHAHLLLAEHHTRGAVTTVDNRPLALLRLTAELAGPVAAVFTRPPTASGLKDRPQNTTRLHSSEQRSPATEAEPRNLEI